MHHYRSISIYWINFTVFSPNSLNYFVHIIHQKSKLKLCLSILTAFSPCTPTQGCLVTNPNCPSNLSAVILWISREIFFPGDKHSSPYIFSKESGYMKSPPTTSLCLVWLVSWTTVWNPFRDMSHKSNGFLILPEASKICGHNVVNCSAPGFWTGPHLIQSSWFLSSPIYFFLLPCMPSNLVAWLCSYPCITNTRFMEGAF